MHEKSMRIYVPSLGVTLFDRVGSIVVKEEKIGAPAKKKSTAQNDEVGAFN